MVSFPSVKATGTWIGAWLALSAAPAWAQPQAAPTGQPTAGSQDTAAPEQTAAPEAAPPAEAPTPDASAPAQPPSPAPTEASPETPVPAQPPPSPAPEAPPPALAPEAPAPEQAAAREPDAPVAARHAPGADPDDESAEGLRDEPKPTYPHLEFSARLMAGFEVEHRHPEGGQSLMGDNELGYEFFLRQARVGVSAYPHKRVKLRLSVELREPGIRTAYANVRIKRWAQLRVGRFKRPFSRIELRSMGKLPFRNRGIFNSRLIERSNWGDRALGAMFWGKLKRVGLTYRLALMHPLNEPTQISFKQGADVVGRVEYEPVKLVSFGVNAAHKVLDDEITKAVHTNAFGGDVRLRTEQLEVVGEFNMAQNADPPTAAARTDPEPPFAMGAMGYVAYEIRLTKSWALQPTVVGEWVDTDVDFAEDETFRTVFGLNVLWKDIVRLMPQVELVQPLGTVSTRSRMARETYYLLASFHYD